METVFEDLQSLGKAEVELGTVEVATVIGWGQVKGTEGCGALGILDG